MTQQEKFDKIISWYAQVNEVETKQLTEQENIQKTREIEELINESFPKEILSLYEKYDGDTGTGYGSFLGHSFIGLEEMKNSLEFSKSRIKPNKPEVPNPKASEGIIEKIINEVIRELPLKKKLGFLKPKWYKVEFETGPGTIGGPYFYPTENTSDREREIIKLTSDARDQISKLTEQLHEMEVQEYNWDNLEITAYGDGKHEIKRESYDFDNELSLTSTPQGAIKTKYFHIKWIPIISDYGGNYIGIDLDPDEKGTKGQVIIFGRDEEDMLVLANSWGDFLDYTLELTKTSCDELKSESHLHDVFRKIMITR